MLYWASPTSLAGLACPGRKTWTRRRRSDIESTLAAESARGVGVFITKTKSLCDGRHAQFVERLARVRIGETYNQYTTSALRRERLRAYLAARAEAEIVLVGEAAGYRGARVSGLPFTSERQLTGRGLAEASATIVQRALVDLGLEEAVLLWNVVPTHPGTKSSNRRPTASEVVAAAPFLAEVVRGRRVVAVGRLAAAVLDAPYVRHPARGGAAAFAEGLRRTLAR